MPSGAAGRRPNSRGASHLAWGVLAPTAMPGLPWRLLLLAAPLLDPGAAVRSESEAARVLARIADGEPPIEEVQRAAAQRSGVDPALLDSWGGRVRTAAWLPRLSVEFRREEHSTRTVGLTGTVESDYVRVTPGSWFGVRAAWDLDSLLFTADELRAAETAARLRRRREEAVQRVTRLYFQRLRLRLLLVLSPPANALERAESELALETATAELDALTGGLYSRPRSR